VTRVAVIGFGITGKATARAVLAAGSTAVVVDDRPTDGAVEAAARIGVELVVGAAPGRLEQIVRRADMVVPSPGVPVGHPVFGIAERLGVEVVSEIELAGRFLGAWSGARPLLVAVTGTNGKTTVTTLVCDALARSGRRAVAAGNIGVPLIEAATGDESVEVIVAEVSSFQLQFTEQFHPDVSCWLNLAPDHLDWHPSVAHYRAAKARIWANQGDGDTVVVNADDAEVLAAAATRPPGSRLVTFSRHVPADWHERAGVLVGPDGELLAVAELPRSFPHDRSNALAAAAVAASAGATLEGIRGALRAGRTGPHRVALVGTAGGVSWYDDSKATTPASVLAAVAGFDSVVLIAGGRNKGLDLGVLGAGAPPVHAVVAIGEAAGEVAAAFAGRAAVTGAGSMADAVTAARKQARPGDTILLSPGCASYDWYRSYAERGEHFASLAQQQMEKERDRC
jgi:UDP-N-acetylmuramoylalanine--D-glutamate ligase